MNLEHKSNIDSILSYILIKKLVTPINKTEAYKLGLVNGAGKKIKEPETDKEKMAYTLFDKIIFKLKRLLGTRLISLNNFLYLVTMNNDFYNKLIVRGSVTQRAEIKKIIKDVNYMKENYNINNDDIISVLFMEEVEDELK